VSRRTGQYRVCVVTSILPENPIRCKPFLATDSYCLNSAPSARVVHNPNGGIMSYSNPLPKHLSVGVSMLLAEVKNEISRSNDELQSISNGHAYAEHLKWATCSRAECRRFCDRLGMGKRIIVVTIYSESQSSPAATYLLLSTCNSCSWRAAFPIECEIRHVH